MVYPEQRWAHSQCRPSVCLGCHQQHHWATLPRQRVSLFAFGIEPVLTANHHCSLPSAQKIKVWKSVLEFSCSLSLLRHPFRITQITWARKYSMGIKYVVNIRYLNDVFSQIQHEFCWKRFFLPVAKVVTLREKQVALPPHCTSPSRLFNLPEPQVFIFFFLLNWNENIHFIYSFIWRQCIE